VLLKPASMPVNCCLRLKLRASTRPLPSVRVQVCPELSYATVSVLRVVTEPCEAGFVLATSSRSTVNPRIVEAALTSRRRRLDGCISGNGCPGDL
jgi:hypothetical protein